MCGVFGTICDDSWDINDASVVCKMLLGTEWTGSAQALDEAHYGEGTSVIWLDDVDCNGNEQHIGQCVFTTSDNCFHSEDAGVSCDISGGMTVP